MSNALSSASGPHEIWAAVLAVRDGAATALGAAPAPPTGLQMVLIATGICLLAAWLIRGLSRPARLALRNCPGRRNSLTPVHILIPLAAWVAASGAIGKALGIFFDGDSAEAQLLAMIAAHAILLACSLLVAAMSFRPGLRRGLGLSLRHWPWYLARGVGGYLMIVPISVGLHALTIYLLPEGLVRKHDLLTAVGTMTPLWRVLAVFAAVVAAPLAEEVFHRGLLQSMLRRYTSSPWAAIIIASAVFALAHFPYPDHIPPMFALGVVLGYTYERSGRLLGPIIIHALFNAVNILCEMTGW